MESSAPTEKEVMDDYKMWKRNTTYLYDLIIVHDLEWPSLTVEWLPGRTFIRNNEYSEQNILFATHTSNKIQNYLIIAKITLPLKSAKPDQINITNNIEYIQKIPHEGEINRARYMPHNPNIIATKTISSDIHVFDRTIKDGSYKQKPIMILKGHDKEGYALNWNPVHQGRLLSGSDDGRICIWDINGKGGKDKGSDNSEELHPLRNYIYGDTVVEALEFHREKSNFFVSAGDDGNICFYDINDKTDRPCIKIREAHTDHINGVTFNPHIEYLLSSCSSDKYVKLWDYRYPKYSTHEVQEHSGEIYNMQWDKVNKGIMATGADDRRIYVWNFNKIGEEQSDEDREDGSPEMMFIHGGHTSKVVDLSWNSEDPWLVASVAENNTLHIWQMAKNIYDDTSLTDMTFGKEFLED